MNSTSHYSELGLVNTREIFQKAMEGPYAVPASNFNNMEQLQAIILGWVESRSPVILQVSGSAGKHRKQKCWSNGVRGCWKYITNRSAGVLE